MRDDEGGAGDSGGCRTSSTHHLISSHLGLSLVGTGALKASPGVILSPVKAQAVEPWPTLSTTQAIGLFTTVGQSRLRGSPGAAPSAFPSASHGADAAWGKSAPGPCPATLSPFPSKPEESPF